MSQTLKQAREEFLGSCQFTAQAPGSYYWCGEYADMYGQLAVVHAIPLYSYVGVELGDFKSFEFEFRDITSTKTIAPQKMMVEDIEPTSREYVENRLRPYLEFWRSKGKRDPFKVKLWSEIPSQCGLNSSGAAAAALAALLQVLETPPERQDALIQNINGWASTPPEGPEATSTFNTIFRRAWILDSCTHNFVGSGAGPFSSLVGCPNGELLLYFTEKNPRMLPLHVAGSDTGTAEFEPQDFARIEKRIAASDWWTKRLPLKKRLREWLGVALVHSRRPADTGRVVPRSEETYRISASDLTACFSSLFPDCGPVAKLVRPMSDFVTEHSESCLPDEPCVRHVLAESLGLLSWMLVLVLQRDNRDELFSHIRTIARFLDFYDAPSSRTLRVRRTIECRTSAAAKAAGPGCGDLVVFGEADQMEDVESHIGKRYAVHYSTYRMGWKAEGVSITKCRGRSSERHQNVGASVPEEPYFRIWTESEERHGTKSEYKQMCAIAPRRSLHTPLVWINLISKTYSFWVKPRRQEIKLTGQPLKLLRLLLERFNEGVSLKDLSEQVAVHLDHVLLNLHNATFGVLRPFVGTETGEFRLLRPYSCENRRKKFTFCLIEPYEVKMETDKAQ